MTPETTSEQNEKLQSSAGMNSTSGSSADVSDSHPWQSALSEEGSTHYDDRPQDAGAFLEESEVCVLPAVTLKPVQQPSLSPSSMVLEPYQQAEDSHKAQGPSQLELSQDLFQPCISPPEEAVQSVHATEELEISGVCTCESAACNIISYSQTERLTERLTVDLVSREAQSMIWNGFMFCFILLRFGVTFRAHSRRIEEI